MPTVKQRLRTVLRKNVQRNAKVGEKQDGGLAMLDEENVRMAKTTTIEIVLPRPQGCSQSFIEGESWEEFVNEFRMYALATDLEKKNGALQVMTLLMCLDGDVVGVYGDFTYATGESKHELQCVLSKYSEYYSAEVEPTAMTSLHTHTQRIMS